MEIIILASGSKGNALLICYNDQMILVDLGISYLSLKNKLSKLNKDVNQISKVLITHEHMDHVKGMKTFLKRHDIEFYMTKGTFEGLDNEVKLLINNLILINADELLSFNGLDVYPVELSHDAKEPVGFVFTKDNKKAVLVTDTGYVDEAYYDILSNADLYIFESNHCPELLMNSRRHFYLKQRILSEKGHLSNQEASWLINEFTKNSEKSIWAVAHISEDCNNRLKIEKSIVDLLEDSSKIDIIYTSQETSEIIVI